MSMYKTPSKKQQNLYQQSFVGSKFSPNNGGQNSFPISPSIERLFKAKESLSSLKTNLKDEIDQKREIEESRNYEFREIVAKIEKNLQLEMRRRSEGLKINQTMFESKLGQVQESLDKKYLEKITQIQLQLELQNKKINTLQKTVFEEKEKNKKLQEGIKGLALSQIEELRTLIETEKVSRSEKESEIFKKISDDIHKLSERIETNKKINNETLENLKTEIKQKDIDSGKTGQLFKSQIYEDIDNLKLLLKNEMAAREQTEEQMSQTIDQIVTQIQDSLKLVSKNY